MTGSLQDQFLAAGLVKKQKAKNIQTAKKKALKQSRANKVELVDEAAELAKKVQQEQRIKSQKLNQQRKAAAEEKALMAQIRQIITLNSIAKSSQKTPEDALSSYSFSHNNKVKTLTVSAENHDLITRGVIAIVSLGELEGGCDGSTYHLIPAQAARKISQRDADTVVLLNGFLAQTGNTNEKTQQDDPYADFEVPDDLIW